MNLPSRIAESRITEKSALCGKTIAPDGVYLEDRMMILKFTDGSFANIGLYSGFYPGDEELVLDKELCPYDLRAVGLITPEEFSDRYKKVKKSV